MVDFLSVKEIEVGVFVVRIERGGKFSEKDTIKIKILDL